MMTRTYQNVAPGLPMELTRLGFTASQVLAAYEGGQAR